MSYAQDADNIVLQNEIKKCLYRQKPAANMIEQAPCAWVYKCNVTLGNGNIFECKFTVPVSDMGDSVFINSMPSQLLIRYLDIL